MTFPIREIEKLSILARLALDGQLEATQHDLQEVVSYIDILKEVNVEGYKAMSHPVPVDIHLRDDTAGAGVGRHGLEQSAGYTDGFIAVPKIIE